MLHASHGYEPPAERASEATPRPQAPLVFDRLSARAVDRAAVEEYGLPSIVLMENAARALLDEALAMLDESDDEQPRVLIVCGTGNNGGDGYALARHLHNSMIYVAVAALGEPREGSDAAINQAVCRCMHIPELTLTEVAATGADATLIVDAILGTGVDRPVAGAAAEAIELINRLGRPVLAVDLPSGMDCDSGDTLGRCVRATRTVTFLGLKAGFAGLDAQDLLGELVVADIGAPAALLERYGRRPPIVHPDAPEHEIDRIEPSHPGAR